MELFLHLLELRVFAGCQHWPPEDREDGSECPHWLCKPVSCPMNRAVSPYIEPLAQFMAFLLHRTIYIHVYIRAGWWRLWKFEVYGWRMEKSLTTILFAQIFHSSTFPVYMKTCESYSPIHNRVNGAVVTGEETSLVISGPWQWL